MFKRENIFLAEVPPPNYERRLCQYKSYYVDPVNKSGVYLLKCECTDEYIGVTKRNLATRIKEHTRDARKNDTNISGISQHLKESGHKIQSYHILANANTQVERNIKEAFYIIGRKPKLNSDPGNLNISWQQCFRRFYRLT